MPRVPSKISNHLAEIIVLIAEGKSTKEMAQKLRRSPKTIENYVLQAKRRAGVHKTAALVATAIRVGWIK